MYFCGNDKVFLPRRRYVPDTIMSLNDSRNISPDLSTDGKNLLKFSLELTDIVKKSRIEPSRFKKLIRELFSGYRNNLDNNGHRDDRRIH